MKREQEPSSADLAMQDGWTPIEGDPYEPGGNVILIKVEEGQRRKRRIGTIQQGDHKIPVYDYPASEVALVYDESTGKFHHISSGGIDAVSGQRIHRDQEHAVPLGSSERLDIANLDNTRDDAIARRPRAKAGRIGERTIG